MGELLNFGDALMLLKNGQKVARLGQHVGLGKIGWWSSELHTGGDQRWHTWQRIGKASCDRLWLDCALVRGGHSRSRSLLRI